jgi:dihydroneopterin aldolase
VTTETAKVVHLPRIADGRAGVRHVFVRDLLLTGSIGVHHHEREKAQRIRVNLDLAVSEGDEPLSDKLRNVVCYEKIIAGVQAIVGRGHVNLVETLAEDIAAMCLADARVRSVRVRVEKLDIVPDAQSVGVEIERFNISG